MASIDLNRVKEVFAEAIALPALERSAYLDEACGDDRALRVEVDAYISAAERTQGMMRDSQDSLHLSERPGSIIGRYKLLEQIGEGGFGVVFMAEQEHPVRRRVALKVIKLGMDTKQVVARFEAERQALAMMDHPNIARIFDAGATATGRPYFVMELVRGVPITDYCDSNNLPVRERLELFVQVCQAVQHAHQKGIIHRDIKPNNVMITMADGRPTPKVIDFGIAKATDQRLTEKTLFTEFQQMIGTPQYMSPEQAEMAGIDIDTRSDVYSLGVLMYELLVGSTPFDPRELRGKAYAEMQRMIREVEPPLPSTRLSTSIGTLPSIAAHRRIEPKRLGPLVRGELDWIAMKSLEKDRTRRYETADGLASDVQRYLGDEAVLACPPSATYRLRKLARKHRAGFRVAAAFVLLLIAATIFSTWQAMRAMKAERLAEARLKAETQSRKQALANLGEARQAVQQITQIADEKLNNVPHLEGVRRELLESALHFYMDFLRQENNDRDIRRETAIAYGRAAEINRYLGNKTKALELIHESIARLEKLAAEPDGSPADRSVLANHYNALPFYYGIVPGNEIVTKLRRSIELSEQLVKDFPDEPSYKRGLTRNYGNLGRNLVPAHLEEAERDMRHSLVLAEEMGDQVAIATACGDLGYLMMSKANPDAEQWFRRASAIWEKQGTQSNWYREMRARSLSDLGHSLVSAGKDQEASKAFRVSVDLWSGLIKDYPLVSESRVQCVHNYLDLGLSLAAVGQDGQAHVAFQKALELAPQDASLHNNLAWRLATSADAKLRDPSRAVQLAKRAVELAPAESSYWNTLGTAQYRAGDWRGAVEALKKSEELTPDRYTSENGFFLAMAYWQLGERDQARSWYERGQAGMQNNRPEDPEVLGFRTEAEQVLMIRQATTTPVAAPLPR